MKEKQYKFEGEWQYHEDLVGESWVLFESHAVDEKTIDSIILNPTENAHLVNWNLHDNLREGVYGSSLNLTAGVIDDMATALAPRLENITWYKVEIEDGLFGLDIFLHCTGEQGLGGKPA